MREHDSNRDDKRRGRDCDGDRGWENKCRNHTPSRSHLRSGSRELPKPAAGEDSRSPVAGRDDEPENDPYRKDDRGRDDGDRRRGDDDDRKDEEDVDMEVAAADVEHAVPWEAGAVRGCMWGGGRWWFENSALGCPKILSSCSQLAEVQVKIVRVEHS